MYSVSKKALEDIEQIWLYTFEYWSKDAADRYVTKIFEEFEYLAAHPESGKDAGHIRTNYRCKPVQSHLIYYRKAKRNLSIEIIRVLHQAMDIGKNL